MLDFPFSGKEISVTNAKYFSLSGKRTKKLNFPFDGQKNTQFEESSRSENRFHILDFPPI